MCTWMENEFMEGNPASSGERLLGRHGAHKLPKTWRSLEGWQRLSPGRSRKPWVRAVWSGIASRLVEQGQHSVGLLVMTGLLSYARPGELLRMMPPLRGAFAEFLSHPGSRRNRQTNEGTNVQRYTRAGRSLGSKTGPLLDGPQRPRLEKPVVALHLSDFVPIFQKAKTDLALPLIVFYQWRCSGPLIDIADGSRTLEQFKKRGRWQAMKTVQRETLPVRTKLGNSARKSPTASPALRRTARGCVARHLRVSCAVLAESVP